MIPFASAPRFLLFTGKGGVGKTSVACATAVALADAGKRVLLVTTDPASNLSEVLQTEIGTKATPVVGTRGLAALRVDPVEAAAAYRERMVGPYRGVLPDASVRSIEEQLSGACTVEIAAFDEFAKLIGDRGLALEYDHVVLDTAPTGHTLRLLELPAAWSEHIVQNPGGVSCVGPLSGLTSQRTLYESARRALADEAQTQIVLVSRLETEALKEAERARRELAALGMRRLHLVLNGVFQARDLADPIAVALEQRQTAARESLSPALSALPRTELQLMSRSLLGIARLRSFSSEPEKAVELAESVPGGDFPSLSSLLPELERSGSGVILLLGKGGVGKTSIAIRIASALAERGHAVQLTTTDPAHDPEAFVALEEAGVRVGYIDRHREVRAYVEETLATAGAGLDDAGRALMAEELAAPCTEEIAVFRAFAREVDAGQRGFVVIDTAPTGHTLLLLDAAAAYHREVLRSPGGVSEEVRNLLPRLRDPEFAKLVLVTLPEATPVHEASQLKDDLGRASMRPVAWVVNQALSPLRVSDPILRARQAAEAVYISEVRALAERMAVVPFEPLTRGAASVAPASPSRPHE
ncbi:MAG TPA: arsenical pump-driving ATPase [Polyangiaceae bacterium]|nr:arsenical pump-driving ATPase [Polyangiaceae bacterium]